MANITLTNLPTVTGLNGTEPLLGVQSGTSVQITTGQIAGLSKGSSTLPFPVSIGGTGDTTLTQWGLLYGNGTAAIGSIAPPAGTNYVLVGSAGSAPTWQPTIPVTAGVDSISFGTTGLTPSTAQAGVITVAGTLNAVNGGTGLSAYTIGDLLYASTSTALSKLADVATGSVLISGGVGVAPSYSSSPTISGTTTSGFFIANGTITGSLSQGAYAYGTLGYSDTNIFQSLASSVNSYNQKIMQNTNAGASASTNIIVSNNLGTANTYFGEFGMNSSGFSGTGAFNAANTVYLDATSADLAIGTTTANAIHFVVNGGATDAATISSAGVFSLATALAVTSGGTGQASALTQYGIVYGASTTAMGITAAGTTGQVLIATTGAAPSWSSSATLTSLTTPLVIGGTTASSTLTLESTSGAGTSDAILFKTGSQVERMRIDTSGNVGIGTSSPSKKLEVFASANSLQIESIVRNDQAGSGVASIGFNVSSSASSETTSTKAGIGLVRQTTYGVGSLVFYNNGTTSAGDFTTSDERMRIDYSGNVSIGSSGTSTGVNLLTNAQITGGTIAYAHLNSGVVQSGVTTQSVSYYSNITSAAASFTTGSSVHFYANPATGGAGSTITSQFGFNAESTLGTQGAATITNAYGFYGNLAAATNRWNLYMGGTANNYMAGALGVGTTSVGAAGTITASSTISDSIGNVRTIVQNSQTSAYVLVATDNGKYISITTGGVTVPASIFSAGQNIVIFNNSSSSQTITQGTSVTMTLAGSATTGNRTLAQYGVATVLCTGSNTFVITGQGLT